MDSSTPRYQPLAHQRPALNYLLGGGKRAVLVWHRRAGKDLTCWNFMWVAAQQRVGIYYYFYPTYAQAKKAIWYGMDEAGIRFLDYIPSGLITHTHDTDMRIHFQNGSIMQLIGSDNVDSIMSTNPVGCVFSEYAIQDPAGWRFVSPILAKNGGWATFAYTPRGHNHGWELYERTRTRPGWYVEKLTVEDTERINSYPLITLDAIDDVRATGVPEEIIQQEYWCSFSVTNEGSYFGQQVLQAEEQGRVCDLVYDPRSPVHTAWDIGVNDTCSIWFIQTDGRTVWAIDYFEKANNEGLPFFARVLQQKGYFYGTHLGPHDIAKREFGTGDQILQAGINLGVHFTRVERQDKKSQIQAAHFLIPRTVFDRVRCERGVEGLKGYEREWDAKMKVFRNTPSHNWASHIADAYMTLACGFDLLDLGGTRSYHTSGAFDPRHYERYAGFDPRRANDYEDRARTRDLHESDAGTQRWDPDEFERRDDYRPEPSTHNRLFRGQKGHPDLRDEEEEDGYAWIGR